MDLQIYYQKIRDMETKITDEFPLMVSVETSDGGKGGTKTEVPRGGWRPTLLVEGLARLAYEGRAEGISRDAGGGQAAGREGSGGGKAPVDAVLSSTELDRLRSE